MLFFVPGFLSFANAFITRIEHHLPFSIFIFMPDGNVGTAKGGIVVAIARELNLPIRYIGVGEKVEDLLPFDSEKFIESLFEK